MQNISGQTNERNLVNAIKKHQPFKVSLGGKTYTIVSAKQLGGGNPEPKADVALITKDRKEIGISMKKPNFGFFESWMNEEKTYKMLVSVGMEPKQAKQIVNGLKEKAAKMSESPEFKSEVLNEYNTMISLVGKGSKIDSIARKNNKFIVENFSVPAQVKSEVVSKLLKDKQKRFGTSSISSSFKVENVYIPLNELLGRNYENFLNNVIGGGDGNPFKAEYVIVGTIKPTIKEQELISLIQSAKSIKQVVSEYSNDPNVNLKFRLRPITATRAAYSTTNAGKYRKGAEFYFDEKIGVSWTVHVAN